MNNTIEYLNKNDGSIGIDGILRANGDFPLTNANQVKGGMHHFNTIQERDAMPILKASPGMLAYVIETDIHYKLIYENDSFVWKKIVDREEIQTFFNGGEGITYNNNTGEISLTYLRSNNNVLEYSDGENWNSVIGDITSINVTTGLGLQGGASGTIGDITGNISLNHLGLENLIDPNSNSIFYWNNSTKKSEFLNIGDGLLINSGVLSNTIINNNQLINGSGYITGIDWNEIGGLQSDINLSEFTNDVGFSTFDGDYNSLTNIPTYTQGSIIFADSDGSLTEDNSQLYWDDVNNRLGIGTKNPTEKLEIIGNLNLYDPNNNSKITFRNIPYSNYIKSDGYNTLFGIRGNLGNGKVIFENNLDTQQLIVIKPTTIGWNLNTTKPLGVNGLFSIDNILSIYNKQSVGIGISNPTEILDVNGNIKADGTLKLYDITDTQTISLNPDGDSYSLGNLIIGDSNANRTVKIADDGLYISRTTDGIYTSAIKANSDGNDLDIRARRSIFFKHNAENVNSLTLYDYGHVQIPTYGQGNVSGVTQYVLGVDLNGKIIESEWLTNDGTSSSMRIGKGIPSVENTSYVTLIGKDAGKNASVIDNFNTLIGSLTGFDSGIFQNSTIIGNAASYFGNNYINSVIIGEQAGQRIGLNRSVAIGYRNAYSTQPQGSFNNTITIGSEVTPTANGQIIIGNNDNTSFETFGQIKNSSYGQGSVLSDFVTDETSLPVFDANGNLVESQVISINNGNVGIGTTSPDAKLTIEGSLSAASQGMENLLTLRRGFNSEVAFESSAALSLGRSLSDLHSRLDFILDDNNSAGHEYDSTVLTMLSNGNVGIGTTAPSEKLDVNGNIKTNGILKLYDVTDTQQIELNPNGDSYILNGNIGIGTTVLLANDRLTIAEGNIRTRHLGQTTNALRITHNSNDVFLSLYNRFSQSSPDVIIRSGGTSYINGGNVGIGTTSPNDKLDIDGDIRVKRTNRKPTHEDVLTSDFVSVGSVSFYTDDWVKVKVIGRGDTGVNKSFAEYLIYYDGTAYNIELLNNIIVGDNSGFPLLRMNGSNLEIKNRDSINAGNYLIYFDDFISQKIFSGKTYNIEDFPLVWINGSYYNTYKDNTFVPNQNISIPNQSEYDTVTSIFLNIKSLTTDFTGTLLGKFNNLSNLQCVSNQISVLDVSQNTNLTQLICYGNKIQTLDVSQLVNLNRLSCQINQIQTLDVSQLVNLNILECKSNQISVLDVSQLVNLTYLECKSNQISVLDISNLVNLNILYCHNNQLDAATNSQILIDLDGHGLSNGYLNSSIFGGGFITPTGIDSFNALLSKSWNILGLTNQITAGSTYNVEDFPKIWIDDLYYNTYKGDTFVPSTNTLMTGQTEYDAVTSITLSSQSLTTDFTDTLLGKFSNLNTLRLQTNSISIIETSTLQNIKLLLCNDNNISVLDVASLTTLTDLYCFNNNISVLDVTNLTLLIDLRCHNNNISALDVTNLTLLRFLYCYNNNISVLDVTNLTLLTSLNCFSNNISVLNTSNLTELIFLSCFSNNISILDISNCLKLTYVHCFDNNISILDVSNAIDLYYIWCSNNNISILDLSSLSKLTFVRCDFNNISNLDLSVTTILATLFCYDNQLVDLDVSNCFLLSNLRCYNNQLDNLVNSQILIDLDNNGLSNGYLRSSIFGGGSLTAAGQTAKANLQVKGWTIIGI